MKSAAYWAKRAEQVLLDAERNTAPYLNRLNFLYRQTAEDIDQKVKKIFDIYRQGMTQEEARRWLREEIPRAEYEALKNQLSVMTDERLKRQALARLNAPAYRYRITRLQYIKHLIAARLAVSADQEKRITTEHYVAVIQDSYLRTMYELQTGTGIAFGVSSLPQSTINRLLAAQWYGRNYSASIWRNQSLVANAAALVLQKGILSGQSVSDMAKSLMEQTYTASMKNAARLVRTEVNYFCNQGALESYKEAEIERYEFIATLDRKTSAVCRAHDGKIYPLDKAVVGENYPPLHPHCRSTVAAVIDVPGLQRLERRAARDPITGKTVLVKRMSYPEWEKEYVDRIGESGILKDVNLNPLPVTAESLGAVKTVHSEILSPVLQLKLKNEHKKLLMSIVSKPLGTEAGATFDLSMKKLNQVIGKDAAAKVRIPKEEVPYIAIHSHPTGGTFTHNDLWLFASDNNMKVLTAVGNNGSVYAVEKSDSFSKKKFFEYYQEAMSQHPDYLKTPEKYAKYMDSLLKGIGNFGINYTART
ncbi:minor capsid protein [Clostridium sp. D33t1_170424_F3]|uniref:minor capsid protein n=1 Tax=Clostridium sp. D33t1_170424_F3 TaxID=2787099 RepID=UPI0018AB4C9D|nr:minor capsid protein [Clostridium sp. D33t1_170424_F3]